MLTELSTAWWRVCSRPSAGTFRQMASGKSHVKTFVGVLVAAMLGGGLSWVAHWLLRDARMEFMGLASVWVKSGTPAPVATWVVLVPLGVVYGFYSFQIVLFLFARILGGKGEVDPILRTRKGRGLGVACSRCTSSSAVVERRSVWAVGAVGNAQRFPSRCGRAVRFARPQRRQLP
jgi:hypothetical protein